MYGLGIRLGFYLQWIASMLASFLVVLSSYGNNGRRYHSMTNEAQAARFGLLCFTAAALVAIIYQAAQGHSSVIDIYVSLLVCFGSYYMIVPTFLWRLMTCFNPLWDPTRWSPVQRSPLHQFISHVLIMATSIFQLWFWVQKVPESSPSSCTYHSFLFVRTNISNPWFRGVNIAFQAAILLICMVGPAKLAFHRSRSVGGSFLRPQEMK